MVDIGLCEHRIDDFESQRGRARENDRRANILNGNSTD